jgi:hypothetical protein
VRLLVTGAGRSGTWWLTYALRACGVSATHEIHYSTRRHGQGDWTCELSWLTAPYSPPEDAYVVHLVRHPLDQIRSRAAWGSFEAQPPLRGRYDPRPKGRWAIEKCPAIAEGCTPIERAAIHWVRWNEMVQRADEVLRIEDVDVDVVERLAAIVRPGVQLRRGELPSRNGVVTGNRATSDIARPEWADIAGVAGAMHLAWEHGYD